MFIIPDGSAGAIAELERRKFTAEEGVRLNSIWSSTLLMLLGQDHLTLLNGMYYCSIVPASSCSWAWVYSIQCIHTLRPFVIVVQGTCIIVSCNVSCRLNTIAAEEIHAALWYSSHQL